MSNTVNQPPIPLEPSNPVEPPTTPVVDEFEAFINEIGEENIIGFLFDNAGRQTFLGDESFSLKRDYIPSIKCLVFNNMTASCVEYKVYKPIDTIQGVLTATKENRKLILSGREILG